MRPARGTCRTVLAPARGAGMILTVLALGCGGGGGGSDALPCAPLSFDRALATPAGGDVYLQESNSTCSTVDVSVVVSNLTDIFTAGFDITYPAGLLQYSSYTLGPLLQKGPPATPPLVIVTPAAGTLQITATRFGPDPDVDAVGSESLIVLRFTRLAPGAAAIDFNTGGGSTVGEVILDQFGSVRPASFAPDHGGMVTVP